MSDWSTVREKISWEMSQSSWNRVWHPVRDGSGNFLPALGASREPASRPPAFQGLFTSPMIPLLTRGPEGSGENSACLRDTCFVCRGEINPLGDRPSNRVNRNHDSAVSARLCSTFLESSILQTLWNNYLTRNSEFNGSYVPKLFAHVCESTRR